MANATSNLITPQKGLISTNPFLSGSSPSTGGTTTSFTAPANNSITPNTNSGLLSQQPGALGAAVANANGTMTTKPITSAINFGAAQPNLSTATGSAYASPSGQVTPTTPGLVSPTNNTAQSSSSGTNSYGLTSSSPNWYQLQPGESTANYNTRVNTAGNIAAATNGGNPVATNSQPTTGSAGANTTFPGLVSSLANTASQPSPNFNQNIGTSEQAQTGLINSIPANSAAVQSATTNLQDLQKNYADQTGIIGNSPIGLSEQGGEQGLVNSQYASKLGAAQTAVQNALQNNAQTQTAYNEAGGLANTAAGASTSQQGTQQQGLGTAAGLAQPSLAAPGQSYANPQTGQFGAIAGAQNGGGIASVGGLQTQIQQGAAVQQMTGIYQQAQGLASTLTSAINSSGYNPASGIGAATTYANGVNQWLQSNSGNPQYQNVANLVSEVANKYAAILNQSGGTPTSVSQVQQQIINGLASGQDIETTLGNLATNAQTSINALQSASGTNSVNGTQSNTNTNSNGGTTFGSFF